MKYTLRLCLTVWALLAILHWPHLSLMAIVFLGVYAYALTYLIREVVRHVKS